MMGLWLTNTRAVLDALAHHCVKATFFPIGKHALWHPEILKQVATAGHTIGAHTWSHANLAKMKGDKARTGPRGPARYRRGVNFAEKSSLQCRGRSQARVAQSFLSSPPERGYFSAIEPPDYATATPRVGLPGCTVRVRPDGGGSRVRIKMPECGFLLKPGGPGEASLRGHLSVSSPAMALGWRRPARRGVSDVCR
jgi:Polysaccharide deacetylase